MSAQKLVIVEKEDGSVRFIGWEHVKISLSKMRKRNLKLKDLTTKPPFLSTWIPAA